MLVTDTVLPLLNVSIKRAVLFLRVILTRVAQLNIYVENSATSFSLIDRATLSYFHYRVYNSDNGSLADLHYHLGSQISLLCEVTAGPIHDTSLQWIFQVRGGVYGHQVTSDAG